MKFLVVVVFLFSAACARPDVTCEEGWVMRGDFCYFVETGLMQYANARAACEEKGATLAILSDVEESNFVGGLSSDDVTWIGMIDVTSERDWQWIDGTEPDFFNWAPGEPNDVGQEDCVNIYNSGMWNDLKCGQSRASTCKKLGDIVCTEDGIFPHPIDCTKFYVCIHDIRNDFECPADLVFNPELDVCDYPANVPGCE